jgi:ribosomal-protein-alanine N-acetyltransferase
MEGLPMTYQLIPMNRSHLAAVAAIERACFSAPWSEAMLAEELYNDNASYMVAQGQENAVLGYAGLQVVLDEGYITNVAVVPAFRRQGVADALIAAFCRFGKEKLAFLTLEVRASNLAAIALYGKHGFSPVGRRKNYYDHPVEDAILMTLGF